MALVRISIGSLAKLHRLTCKRILCGMMTLTMQAEPLLYRLICAIAPWAMGIVIRMANTAHPIRSSGYAQKNTV